MRTPPAEPSRNRRRARPEPVSESLEMPTDALAVTPLASVPPPSGRESSAPRVGRVRFARALRVLTTVAKIAGVLLAIGGAVAVGRLTRDYVRTSPAFAIATIELEGRERLDEAEVLRAAGIALGTNVFELSPEDVRARLERHPWIAHAEVERRLPGTFRLKVVERHAALVLALGPSLYLVDDEGKVFKEVAPGDPVDFPIVSGVERDRFLRERAWRSALLTEIRRAARRLARRALRREPIAEIHVEADDGLTPRRRGRDGGAPGSRALPPEVPQAATRARPTRRRARGRSTHPTRATPRPGSWCGFARSLEVVLLAKSRPILPRRRRSAAGEIRVDAKGSRRDRPCGEDAVRAAFRRDSSGIARSRRVRGVGGASGGPADLRGLRSG
ncbi:MAG: FtsQ-type POTRA domain-containing protein [Polyangiales bacterium]